MDVGLTTIYPRTIKNKDCIKEERELRLFKKETEKRLETLKEEQEKLWKLVRNCRNVFDLQFLAEQLVKNKEEQVKLTDELGHILIA